jgi:hypothetical protein
MYNAADDSDVPAPFDLELEPLFPLDEGIGGNAVDAILEAERGSSSAKASKRSLVIVDEGVRCLCTLP